MITCALIGDLCNQMFQIATGYALARKSGVDFAINWDRCYPHTEPYRNTLFSKIPTTKHQPSTQYKEQGFDYKEIPKQTDCELYGFYQSGKYFLDYKDEIKNLFVLPEVEIPENTVGIHIRRGDYVRHPNVHPMCSLSYYEKAINLLNINSAIVCTDDPHYAETNLPYKVYKGSPEEDLAVLSECDYSIMSNSTFSWWGVFLGKEKKKVVTPTPWFGVGGPKNYEDIYLPEWTRLDR